VASEGPRPKEVAAMSYYGTEEEEQANVVR